MKYEAELLAEIIANRGHQKSSIHYESECKEAFIEECKGSYPKLCDYESEWLNYMVENPIGEFPYETITNVTEATINNVVPFAFKSATLKGNTLVNLVKTSVYGGVQHGTCVGGDYLYKVIESIDGDGASILTRFQTIYPLSPSTVYYLKLTDIAHTNAFLVREHDNGRNLTTQIHDLENKIIKFTTSELGTSDLFFYQHQLQVGAKVKYSENFIISDDVNSLYNVNDYFTGIQSVKIPVLTTKGKNLLPNIKFIHNKSLQQNDGNITDVTTDDWACEDYLDVPQQKTLYTNMSYIGLTWVKICFYDENKNYISFIGNDTIIFPENAKYWRVGAFVTPENSHLLNQIMLCNSLIDARSAYEPYKSNILTVNEEVELRGIGGVRDELDCLTGEVTQRIGEVIFDGSVDENWTLHTTLDNVVYFRLTNKFDNFNLGVNLWGENTKCNKFISMDWIKSFYVKLDKEFLSNDGTNCAVISIGKEKLTSLTAEGFKQWLSQNPITVQYKLATESIKTVDLSIVNQDGQGVSKLKPIEGTMHMKTDGQPLKPLLSAEVPVEAITQNLASFINEE